MSEGVLVVGASGQDGRYLVRDLLARGNTVTAALREPDGFGTLPLPFDPGRISTVALDLTDAGSVRAAVEDVRPERVFHLAAMSSVAASWDDPVGAAEINAMGTIRLLEAVHAAVPRARFLHASSSEIFGSGAGARVDEAAPFNPTNPYAAAKLHAHLAVRQARARGLHAVNAILFNHESPLRGDRFVTRKITRSLARLAALRRGGVQAQDEDILELGNIDIARDWGDAEEYVDGMIRVLDAPEAGDYILATGRSIRVRDFVDAAAAALDLPLTWHGEGLDETGVSDGRTIVRINPRFFRPAEADAVVGDASKAARDLGWRPRSDAATVARRMALADLADQMGMETDGRARASSAKG